MIDVQIYRARIGVFALVISSVVSAKSSVGKNGKAGNQFNWVKFLTWKKREWIGTSKVVILMTCIGFVCMIILVIFKLVLTVAGDPGPYEILKSVQGSFNQGNIVMFGETAGPQCACNALFSVCWSLVRKISCWTTRDLDHILIQGDNMYKSLNKESFLSVDDLPREIHIFQFIASVEMKVENLYDGVVFVGEPFLRNILTISNNSSGCLLFICNYVVSVIKYLTTRGTTYFIVDSHCRNSRGITDNPFGFSVLLQFADIVQAERYIEEAYNIANRDYPPYFQIQFLVVNISDSDLRAIQTCQINLFRNIKRMEKQKGCGKKKENKMKQTRLRTEKAKERMRKTRSRHNVSREGDYSDSVSTFKKIIQSGPSFICIVCNRCLHRRSVTLFSENKHQESESNMFNFICSHDNNFYICKTCAQKLNKNQIPWQPVCNKLQIYDFPEDLRCTRRLERVLIARRLQFKKITIMPKGQSLKLKGAICNIPVDVVHTCNTLP